MNDTIFIEDAFHLNNQSLVALPLQSNLMVWGINPRSEGCSLVELGRKDDTGPIQTSFYFMDHGTETNYYKVAFFRAWAVRWLGPFVKWVRLNRLIDIRSIDPMYIRYCILKKFRCSTESFWVFLHVIMN